MKTLDIYSRQGCHLCDVLLEAILPLVRGKASLQIHDIDTREDWRREYGTRVPVVEYDGELVCQYHLDPDALRRIFDDEPA